MVDRSKIARIIDANTNRAREGIRVLEEVVRFILDDAEASKQLKQIRHGLITAVEGFGFSRSELLESRDSEADVGRKIQGTLESDRESIEDIIASNFSRIAEALRAIEEFGKLVDPKSAEKIKDLRYEVYTLEKTFILPE